MSETTASTTLQEPVQSESYTAKAFAAQSPDFALGGRFHSAAQSAAQ